MCAGAAIQDRAVASDKAAAATRHVDDEGEGRRVIIDDFEGHIHEAYAAYRSSVFIINRNG